MTIYKKNLHKPSMQAVVSFYMLSTFTLLIAAINISVDFKLANGEISPLDPFNFGDFDMISGMVEFYKTSGLTEEPITETIRLEMIENKEMLEQLKSFWQYDIHEDIGPEKFTSFIRASNYLGLRGSLATFFVKNIVKTGLLCKYSSEIIEDCIQYCPNESWDICWPIFIEFAAQTGNEVRISKTGGEVTIYSADDPRTEEYGDLGYSDANRLAIKKLTIRCPNLRDTRNVESTSVLNYMRILKNFVLTLFTRNSGNLRAPNFMKILTWFVRYLDLSSLYIGKEFKLESQDIHCLADEFAGIKGLF